MRTSFRIFDGPTWFLLLFAIVVSSTSVDPNDTWWHIRSGEYYVAHHSIPSGDVFSHTAAGERVYAHEWLSQVILYFIHHWFGFVGIRVLNSLMAATAMLLLWRFFRKATIATLPVIFVLVLVFPDVLGRVNTRPEIFTLPLFIGFFDFIVHRDRSRLPSRKTLLATAALACLWANLHGMALLGLMFLLAYTAGEALVMSWPRLRNAIPEWARTTRDGLVGDLQLIGVYSLAVLITPMGIGIYEHAYKGREFLPGPLGIMEWLSPFTYLSGILHSFLTQQFPWVNIAMAWQFLFLGIPMAYFFSMPFLAARRQLPTPADLFAVLLAIYQGASAVRFRWLFFIPLFWVARAIGRPERHTVDDREKRISGVQMVFQAFMVLAIMCGTYMMLMRGISFTKSIDSDRYPVGIANFLEDVGAEGKLYNDYNWGGYLIYRLWPQCLVFIDGRTDLYSFADRNLLLDHVAISQKDPGYADLLDRYDVDILIASEHIYFPGPETANEIAHQREQQLAQMTDARSPSVALASKAMKPVQPDSLDARDRWIPLLVNLEGSVYVRNGDESRETVERARAFFAERGIAFDEKFGVHIRTLIEHTDLLVRYNIVDETVVRGVVESRDDPSSDSSLKYRVELANALLRLEFYRDAIELLEDVLEVDRYNNDALVAIAYALHLVGENEKARSYLERSASLGRNDAAVGMMQHCLGHQTEKSNSSRQLPPLNELASKWNAARQ